MNEIDKSEKLRFAENEAEKKAPVNSLSYIIVTNTYQRPSRLVERSLLASLNQKIRPLKVILIDQGENPLSLSEEILNNKLFERQKTGKVAVSAARNSLVIPEGTEWIFFCDDDGYPCSSYSEKLKEITEKYPGLEIIAGSIVREDNNEYYSLRHKKGGSLGKFRYTKNLMGSNFVVKAGIFDKLGRFDENFGAGSLWGSSEETDFCWKAFFSGISMEYFRELIVYHVPPFNESLNKGFKKAFFYGTGKGALVWKWLIRKRKIKVIYELLEMFIVPFIQMVIGVLKFKFQMIPINGAVITGRIYGLLKAPFVTR